MRWIGTCTRLVGVEAAAGTGRQDIFSLFHLDRSFKFISKRSIFLYPIVGWSMFLTGASTLSCPPWLASAARQCAHALTRRADGCGRPDIALSHAACVHGRAPLQRRRGAACPARRPRDAEPHGPPEPAEVPGRLPRAAAAGRVRPVLPGGHALQRRAPGRMEEGARGN